MAFVFQRGNQRQVILAAQLEVFGAAAGGDVHDAGAFGLADLVPQDHLVRLGCALA